ncbi:MAG: LapA family protein [Ahniella sp.]|nr:LapA family protein [Ahniella sp.]
MKRWLLLVLMLSMAAVAAAFSLVNRDAVALDLLFARLQFPLGVLVIAAVFLGAALAGLVLFSTVILGQNLKLRTIRRELDKLKSAQAQTRAAAVEPIAPNPPVV